MPLHFAYGSNMDRAQMAARCPASRPLGLGRLERHRPVIMREGYASVVRDARGAVFGMIWDLALADVAALDRYEGVSGGLYVKRHLAVIGEHGARRALVYLGTNAGPGQPRPGYLEGVLAAAEAAGLPAPYRRILAALGPVSRADRPGVAPPHRSVPVVRATRRTPLDPPAQRGGNWSWNP